MQLDDAGYQDYLDHISGEGLGFDEWRELRPVGSDTLPDKKTLTALSDMLRREMDSSTTARLEPMEQVKQYWKRYDMQPYTEEEMLLAEQVQVSTPLIRSRVYQAHGSLYNSLALFPFFQANVESGQDGAIAAHAEAALEEQLQYADFLNGFDQALKGSLVGTLGILKASIADPDEPRLEVEAVDIRDLYLSPHNVRDLQQCTMIAQRYFEPLGWVRDQALNGLFDPQGVKKLSADNAHPYDDANASARELHAMSDSEGWADNESGMVELLEVYMRYRPDEGSMAEMWRLIVAKSGWVVLRAEPWEDGYPFWPIRHERGSNTIYAPSFSAVLKDLQWGNDQLFSVGFEADRLSVAPIIEYDPLSPTAQWLLNRREEAGGHAVRIKGGDLVPSRGGQSLKVNYMQPANMAVQARMNQIESMAGSATIPMLPAQTYRSATEHRFAQSVVTAKEAQMLKVIRGDLTRFAEYIKRLYWKYIPEAAPNGAKWLRHGSIAYSVTEESFLALRFEPRGTTTQADQQQMAAATGETLQLAMQLAAQKPMLVQAGAWPQVYAAARMRLEALGVQEWRKVLGDPPSVDPYERELDPRAAQASMMLMQAQAGQSPMLAMQQQSAAPDQQMRGSDAAPTVMPGGNPLAPGAPGGLN